AFKESVASGNAVYFSRSRNELWRKGATSGHVQLIREILVDCDNDAVIYKVEQLGAGACHTGHRSCFYRRLGEDGVFAEFEELKFDPEQVYGKK
ncbi:MAG: phosphoribosyl-AMP cyclohydrolase, partial [Victivallaceae bacterium]